ncbi:hypothetical protein TELCIR_14126 [Teladorsagia circumcincta]|uniref:Uncharacterized protein n=1 Tax=Teladorsagia circumcincta TaxID=45464 RepID=A0A2G9U1Z2_TELCI|nr:hypothetical protein TELCIR_14126 [Teladorsagia circumcincta]
MIANRHKATKVRSAGGKNPSNPSKCPSNKPSTNSQPYTPPVKRTNPWPTPRQERRGDDRTCTPTPPPARRQQSTTPPPQKRPSSAPQQTPPCRPQPERRPSSVKPTPTPVLLLRCSANENITASVYVNPELRNEGDPRESAAHHHGRHHRERLDERDYRKTPQKDRERLDERDFRRPTPRTDQQEDYYSIPEPPPGRATHILSKVMIIVANADALQLAKNHHWQNAGQLCELNRSVRNCGIFELRVDRDRNAQAVGPNVLPFTKTLKEARGKIAT